MLNAHVEEVDGLKLVVSSGKRCLYELGRNIILAEEDDFSSLEKKVGFLQKHKKGRGIAKLSSARELYVFSDKEDSAVREGRAGNLEEKVFEEGKGLLLDEVGVQIGIIKGNDVKVVYSPEICAGDEPIFSVLKEKLGEYMASKEGISIDLQKKTEKELKKVALYALTHKNSVLGRADLWIKKKIDKDFQSGHGRGDVHSKLRIRINEILKSRHQGFYGHYMIRLDRQRNYDRLAEVGEMRRFSLIPYVSLKTDAKEGARLNRFRRSLGISNMYDGKLFYSPEALLEELKNDKYAIKLGFLDLLERNKEMRMKKGKFGEDWNLENIGARKAQEYSGGEGAIISIVDSGVDYTHVELSGRFGTYKGHNFVNNNDDPMDLDGHGTHVAGTAAGESTGVANKCTLYAMRVLDEDGWGTEGDVLAGIEESILKDVDVINMSLGSSYHSKPEEELCFEAWNRGIFISAAAGNDGYGPDYPAACEGAHAVAAVDRWNERAGFSNIWHTNFISAPGVDIYSSLPKGRYGEYSGTSMASPHVAGGAALLFGYARNNGLWVDMGIMENLMIANSDPLGSQEEYGHGLMRVDKMVEALECTRNMKKGNSTGSPTQERRILRAG